MNQPKFRVLLLDDKENHLNIIKDALHLTTYQVFDKIWTIEIEAVNIIVVKKEDKTFDFDASCIQKIEKASIEPFDLLILDIGYLHKDLKIEEHLRPIFEENELEYRSNQKWKQFGALSPDNLVLVEIHENSNFKKNFVGHENSIFGYTYIRHGQEKLFYDEEGCLKMLNKSFRNAALNNNIKLEGTRKKLFYNSPEFEGINEKLYYPYILSQYLEKLIHIEIWKKEAGNLKKNVEILVANHESEIEKKKSPKRDPGTLTIRDIFYDLTFPQLWYILGALVTLVVGAVSVGVLLSKFNVF